MKFLHTLFLFSILIAVSGRATQSSESKSASSSKSSSSEENRHNDNEWDLVKIDGNNNTTAEEVRDTETAEKVDLKEFDDALEADGKSEGYVQKRLGAHTNGTENLSDEDIKVMDELEKTMSADSEEEHDAQKNETVIGIDTFGAQGI